MTSAEISSGYPMTSAEIILLRPEIGRRALPPARKNGSSRNRPRRSMRSLRGRAPISELLNKIISRMARRVPPPPSTLDESSRIIPARPPKPMWCCRSVIALQFQRFAPPSALLESRSCALPIRPGAVTTEFARCRPVASHPRIKRYRVIRCSRSVCRGALYPHYLTALPRSAYQYQCS